VAGPAIVLAPSSWQPILGGEFPVIGLARLAGEVFDQVVGYCAAPCAGPYVETINGRGEAACPDQVPASYVAL
jgi:hypothetical protein